MKESVKSGMNTRRVPIKPVTTHPILGVNPNICETVSASMSLSGTFFCVMHTAVSFPRTATAVWPDPEIALKAYSVHSVLKVSGLVSQLD